MIGSDLFCISNKTYKTPFPHESGVFFENGRKSSPCGQKARGFIDMAKEMCYNSTNRRVLLCGARKTDKPTQKEVGLLFRQKSYNEPTQEDIYGYF